MAHKIEFTKPDSINDVLYEKGDTLNVSSSIYGALKKTGSVKDFVEKKPKKSK